MYQIFTWSILLSLFPVLMWGQTDCPDCTINLPDNLPADTIFITPMPNGNVGTEYGEDISFRLPTTTDAVAVLDSTVFPGLPIEEITITSIGNLPVGLSWEADRQVYPLPDTTDGCVRFCGVPQQRGMFLVRVTLTARVFVVTQSLTFNMPLFIGGAVSETDGFAMENNRDCGVATVDFFNNLPSDNDGSYEYFWDFGNERTSTEENPPAQFYDEAGIYPVRYRAVIDTIGYVLNSITITENEACDDLIGNADLFVTVTNEVGEELSMTEAFEEVELPLTIQLFTPLEEDETFTLNVTDRDRLLEGADDDCGTFSFTIEDELIAEGGMRIELNIMNNPDTITSVDSVYVYEFPAAPDILVSPAEEVCQGEAALLKTTTYAENINWYLNDSLLLDATQTTLEAAETGRYRVSYTSDLGCTVFSEIQNVFIKSLPPAPDFTNVDNLLQLSDESILTSQRSLQWYLNGNVIPDAIDATLCVENSGIYTLEIVDGVTGCTNSASVNVDYDANIINCNLTNVEDLRIEDLKIYPNPASDFLQVELATDSHQNLQIRVLDLLGRSYLQQTAKSYMQIEISSLPNGVYYLELRDAKAVLTHKFVKQ